MNWYLKVLKQYSDFSGRARRKEYWMFVLFNMIFAIVAMILDNVLGIEMEGVGYGPLYGLYVLAMIIPGLALTVRRLHDVGKSGWMILIALIPLIGGIWVLVLMVTDSIPEENEYGQNPKEIISETNVIEFKDFIKKPIVIISELILISYVILPYYSINMGTWGSYSKSGLGLFFLIFDKFSFMNFMTIIIPIATVAIILLLQLFQKEKNLRMLLKIVILAMHVILFVSIAFLAEKHSIKYVGFGLWFSLVLSIVLFFEEIIENAIANNYSQNIYNEIAFSNDQTVFKSNNEEDINNNNPIRHSSNTIIINHPANKSNGLGVAGFVLALIALFLGWVPILGWIIWVLGLIFSFAGIFKQPRGLAIAGLVISLIDIILLLTLFGAVIAGATL